ncbi:helix-turn-helix domain-containing protein [Veillonella sp. R32]|uniref:helix-turn-helix domain-containing protein n=1 Tax=Veillonella sp. R32 TaxID=2021312 RepID=UPI001389D861|nr:helix-turn-helix transcriptional regulator [Veillonella sp. R32]KAF1682289.1 transcriptional regulator [Veillonella sp. R32]
MRTWEDYKKHVKAIDEQNRIDIEEIEELSSLVTSIIKRRNELGLSQRALAEQCGIPQSSVARIESFKTIPKVDTLLKIMQPLGLRLQIISI